MDSDLSKRFGSVRSAHSYDRHIGSRRDTPSFVTINEKRSWRPPPYTFQPILDFMPSAAPLALAAANPFLRLYVERHEGGGAFLLDGYQVTPVSLEENFDTAEGDGSGLITAGEHDAIGMRRAARVSGQNRGTSGLVVEDDVLGVDLEQAENEDTVSVQEDDAESYMSLGDDVAQVIPLYLHGLGTPQGISSCASHRYPFVGTDGVAPISGAAAHLAMRMSASHAAEVRDRSCLRECGHTAEGELSLCVKVLCKSPSALRFAVLGAWWLSRYYGVSLRVHHMHPAQLPVFKEVLRSLFIKELQFEDCTLSEDCIQCISTCNDLLALSLISCSAAQEVQLRYIDSILRKSTSESRFGSPNGQHEGGDSDGHLSRTIGGGGTAGASTFNMATGHLDTRRENTSWYLSGVRSLGLLRRLRCLHLLHTPIHESFLQALPTCSALECLILHRCRGVRSLDGLQKLPQLQALSLHGLSVTDGDVLVLEACPNLRQLVLDECRNLTDLSFLSRLQRTLSRLLIPRTLLSTATMQHIGKLDNLIELDVQSLRQLTDVEALKSLVNVRTLIARDNLLTNQGCAALRSMSSLQRLDLSSCRCLTSLAAVLDGLNRTWAQRLHSLNLSQTVVTDEGLRCLVHCTGLRYLNLAQCASVSQLSFLQNMSSLRWLDLGGTRVTEEETSTFVRKVRALRLLSLAGCATVRTLSFARRMSRLEYFNLEATAITNDTLACLRGCRKLRFLSLQHCAKISSIDGLARLPRLLELNVSMTAVGGTALDAGSLLRDEKRDRQDSAHSSLTSPTQTLASPAARASPPPSSTASLSPLLSDTASSVFVCFPEVQVLHLNGCSRITQLEWLTQSLPQLRILYADRISVTGPRVAVGIGFSDPDDRHRRLQSQRPRSTRVSVSLCIDERDEGKRNHEGARSSTSDERCVSKFDLVLQQYVPQPPVAPRPRTAHPTLVRPHPPSHQRGASLGDADNVGSSSHDTRGIAATVQRLVLRRSSLQDAMLPGLCRTFASLTSLDLTKCVDVQSLPGIESLSSLQELLLSQSSVGNDGVRAVGQCVSLEVLRLSECRAVTDVNALAPLTKLRVLGIERTQVTSTGFNGIGECRSLQFLSCTECRYLSDVNVLGSLQRLLELHLELTAVRDSGIRGLMRCVSLQRLYFTRCQHLTAVGDMRAALPQLEVLDVYGTSIPTRVAGQGQQFGCTVM